ncbi:MAG: CPBP family intramembrane glutamic endopeptidase [Candidatus Binatia bacterium]
MRSAGFLALLIGVLAVTSVASPGVAWLIGEAHPFARVYDRVFEILLALGLAATWRRLDLGSPGAVGLTRAGAGRALGRGLVAGMAGLAVGLALAWAGGALVPALRYPPLKTAGKVMLGLGAALGIGVGEELLFRGLVFRRLERDAGRSAAVVVTTVAYAAVHAIRVGGGDVRAGPWAGIERTAGLFAPLAEAATWPSVAGLAGLGLLLAMLRLRSGSLWCSIGVHAGWVAVFRVGRLAFDLRRVPAWLVGPGWPPLIGGLAGWLALGTTAWVAFRLVRVAPPVVGIRAGPPKGDMS